MATHIHPSAVVEPDAQLGANVDIGPFAYVGAMVQLGDGTRLHHHASVEGFTVLGAACEIFPYACIGGKTQDLKYKGGRPGLRAGDRNVFREYVTVHAATYDGDNTMLGSDNTVLAYSHIAHDCVLGSHIVMSNAVSMAGHVIVEDHVVIGGAAGIHQFCRIGAHAMLSAMAKLVQDLPPYFIADGTPAEVRAFNKVGLERSGHTPEQLERVNPALLFELRHLGEGRVALAGEPHPREPAVGAPASHMHQRQARQGDAVSTAACTCTGQLDGSGTLVFCSPTRRAGRIRARASTGQVITRARDSACHPIG